jgi:hypothetical protein
MKEAIHLTAVDPPFTVMENKEYNPERPQGGL